jgi:hypothetical protein
VTVDRPVLDAATVAQFLADRPEAARLVKDAQAAKVEPVAVAEATGDIPWPAQKVEALAVFGTHAGQPTAAVRLFGIDASGTRTELANTKTTVVAASPKAARWRLGLAVQAGAAFTPEAGVVAGLAWLRRGTSSAAEDNSLSLLTPALLVHGSTYELALLPASLNLGRIPHQPFSDLWIAPVVTRRSLGAALVATF